MRKRVQFAVYLDLETAKLLREYCATEKVEFSVFIGNLVRKFLEAWSCAEKSVLIAYVPDPDPREVRNLLRAKPGLYVVLVSKRNEKTGGKT